MKSIRFFPLLKNSILLMLGTGLLAAVPLRADLTSDLAFTAFSNVDVNAMAEGKVLQVRGPLLNFQRGIVAQSLYILNATPSEVQRKLVDWNPATHPKLEVWIHHSLPANPTPNDFSDLASLPDNSSVNYQINATAQLDPKNSSLQLDKNEALSILPLQAQKLDKKALYVKFWSQVLANRVNTFLSGKLESESYSVGDGEIRPMDEIKSLIRSDTKIYADFHPLFSQTPLYSSTKAAPAAIYYDCFDIQGYGSLGTGAVYQAPNGAAIQSFDVEYFANSSIYVTIELEKLWPVTVNGKNETLVWRQDLVSTPNVSYLHGVERLASSMIMLQEVQTAIDAFRSEFK
jgi:hypothetical protein